MYIGIKEWIKLRVIYILWVFIYLLNVIEYFCVLDVELGKRKIMVNGNNKVGGLCSGFLSLYIDSLDFGYFYV